MKRFLNALLTLALASCTIPAPANPPAPSPENIRMIDCSIYIGTAWVVAPNTLITANHVVEGVSECKDDKTGVTVTVSQRDEAHDFAILSMDTGKIKPVEYSCSRFVPRMTHISYGYGGGKWTATLVMSTDMHTTKDFIVEGTIRQGARFFAGPIVSGMSGGPIMDVNNVAHGINNASDGASSISYELADTPLCVNPTAQPLPPLYPGTSRP